MGLSRYQVVWSGFQGAPGYTTLYHDGTQPSQVFADDVRNFLATALTGLTLADKLPLDTRLTFNSFSEEIDEASGDLAGTIGLTAPATIVGTGGGNRAAPAGVCVTWLTSDFANGRRVSGRTFLVPSAGAMFSPDGSLDDTQLGNIRTAAQNFINAVSVPVIYHRPPKAAPGSGRSHVITAAKVSDKAAVLRSRRD